MRISTQNVACSQRQMNTCHTSFSYILWAYGEHIMSKWSSRTSDQFLWLVSEKKTEAVNAYFIKNSKGEGEGRGIRGRGEGGEGGSPKQSEWLGGVVWVYKRGIKWPVIAMANTRKPQSLSVCLRETENWNSSYKTLFYKDCSLRFNKKNRLTTSPCEATDE